MTSHLIQRSDAAGGGVGEEAAVQHHGPTQQVEPQEHGQSQHDLQLRLRERRPSGGLLEVGLQPHRVRVNGGHGQLQGNQSNTVRCHGDSPIFCADVVRVELPREEEGENCWSKTPINLTYYVLLLKPFFKNSLT